MQITIPLTNIHINKKSLNFKLDLKRISKILTILLISTSATSCAGKKNIDPKGPIVEKAENIRINKDNRTIAKTLINGHVGRLKNKAIEENLTILDKSLIKKTAHKALEYGMSDKVLYWHNPESNNHGHIVPHRGFRDKDGKICRKYSQSISFRDKEIFAEGVACKDSKNGWIIIK